MYDRFGKQRFYIKWSKEGSVFINMMRVGKWQYLLHEMAENCPRITMKKTKGINNAQFTSYTFIKGHSITRQDSPNTTCGQM